jgi:hypothetical protein
MQDARGLATKPFTTPSAKSPGGQNSIPVHASDRIAHSLRKQKDGLASFNFVTLCILTPCITTASLLLFCSL